MNEHDTLINRIDSWTQDVLHNPYKLDVYLGATQSTTDAHKDAVIDDLLGETQVNTKK